MEEEKFGRAVIDGKIVDLDNATAGVVDARFNWWGSNSKPSRSKFKNNNGTVRFDPWLVIRVNANPKVIKKGQYSKITVDMKDMINIINTIGTITLHFTEAEANNANTTMLHMCQNMGMEEMACA